MVLLIVYDAALAIQEQTIRRPFLFSISEEERVSRAFFNFWCCKERWFGMNRTSQPDWVKIFGDPNGQIKLRAKQKYKFLSATSIKEVRSSSYLCLAPLVLPPNPLAVYFESYL